MEADRLKGMTIVALDDAERLGTIGDLLFELNPLRVAAIEAASGESRFVVPFNKVRALGADAVTVDDSGVARTTSIAMAASQHRLSTLRDLKVVDEQGTFLGKVDRLEIDDSTGRVTEIEAQRGGIAGLGSEREIIDAESIRGVGTEVLTVRR